MPLAGGLLDELTGLLAAGAGQEPQLSAGAPTGEEHGDDDGFLESLIGGDPSIAGAVFDASDMVTDLLFHELLSDQDVFGIDPAAEPPLTDDLVGGLLGVVGLEAALAQPQAAASDFTSPTVGRGMKRRMPMRLKICANRIERLPPVRRE